MKTLLSIIGIVVLVGIVGGGAAAGAALFGKAQQCPSAPGPARSDQVLQNLIKTSGATIPDAEATTLAQRYLAGKVENARLCFTPGLGHLSGNMQLGSLSPSFYVSTGIDLSGATPKTVNLDIRIGSLPNLSFFSPARSAIENMINENLSQVRLTQKYSIDFTQGSVTIQEL